MVDTTNIWQIYDDRKRAWIAANPNATTAAYEAFVRALCAELGI